MKVLLVLASSLAIATCTPTLGFISGILGGGGRGGGGGGLFGGGGGGAAVPGISGGGVPGLGGGGAAIPGIHGGAVPGGVAVPLGGGGGVPGADVAGGPVGLVLGTAHSILGGRNVFADAPGVGLGGTADKGYLQRGGVYPVGGGGLFQALGFLGQGLTDIVGNAGSILDDIVHLRIPAILDDGFNAIISTARAAGGIINAIIPGLGSLLGNVVVSFAKILICVLGSPGLTGSVLGDRRPGRDNPVDIPAICNKDYGSNYGYAYDGDYDADKIITFYHVRDSRRQAEKFIDDYTKGKGVNALGANYRIVYERLVVIFDRMDKDYNSWNDDDVVTICVNVVIVISLIGDSYQPGLGRKIADEYITVFQKNNKNKRFPDLSKYRDEIYDGIKGVKADRWNGAFNDKARNNNRDSNDSTSNSNDRTSNSNDQSADNERSNSESRRQSDTEDNESRRNTNTRNDSSRDYSDSSNNRRRSQSRDDSSDERNSGSGSNTSRDSSDSSDASNESGTVRSGGGKVTDYSKDEAESHKAAQSQQADSEHIRQGSGQKTKNADGSSSESYSFSDIDKSSSGSASSSEDAKSSRTRLTTFE